MDHDTAWQSIHDLRKAPSPKQVAVMTANGLPKEIAGCMARQEAKEWISASAW